MAGLSTPAPLRSAAEATSGARAAYPTNSRRFIFFLNRKNLDFFLVRKATALYTGVPLFLVFQARGMSSRFLEARGRYGCAVLLWFPIHLFDRADGKHPR